MVLIRPDRDQKKMEQTIILINVIIRKYWSVIYGFVIIIALF